MEEYGKTSIWELLKILQGKVKQNSEIIKKNVKSIEIVTNNYALSSKRNKIINSIHKKNFDLTNENTKLLNLHNSLFKFYNEFMELFKENSVKVNSSIKESTESWKRYRKVCMKKSISGDLQINSQHPFINDKEFLNELMLQCQNRELYERCSEIKKVHKVAH